MVLGKGISTGNEGNQASPDPRVRETNRNVAKSVNSPL